MLAKLQDLHAKLRGAIGALAELTRQSEPDAEALSAARLRLSRLSRRRRVLIDYSILPVLPDIPAVTDLAADAAEQSLRSSEHVGRWTLSAVCADWAGYQLASAEMRRQILRRVDREARVLYPLLMAAKSSPNRGPNGPDRIGLPGAPPVPRSPGAFAPSA
jgi:hypothetical protein